MPTDRNDELRESIFQRSEALADAIESVLLNGGPNVLETVILAKACDEILDDIHELPEAEWKDAP